MMPVTKPLICTGTLSPQTLAGQAAVVTGAGGGIGYEAARSLAWLGAHVIVAEINKINGSSAVRQINQELGREVSTFIQTDVGDEGSIARLKRWIQAHHLHVDIVLNNATITPMGAIKDVDIRKWDASYRVNLRGPVLLAKAFLPEMLDRNSGVFISVSSVGGKFMGAYEILKSAQVELARTLDAELEGSGVIAFTIGPGIVPDTPGAQAGIKEVAHLYEMPVEDFISMSKDHLLTVEAAGAGLAAAVALAPNFRGLEIDSKAALIAAGIQWEMGGTESPVKTMTDEEFMDAYELCRQVHQTLNERSDEWNGYALFQRQWLMRDFKNYSGSSVDKMLEKFQQLEDALKTRDLQSIQKPGEPVEKLAGFYKHYHQLTAGYLKDPQQREEQLGRINSWLDASERLAVMLRLP